MNLSNLSKLLCGVAVCVVSGNVAANFSITNIPIIVQAPESERSDFNTISLVASVDVEKRAVTNLKNNPPNGPSFYVQLLSVQTVTLKELAEEFEALNDRWYSICTTSTDAWYRVFSGPYDTHHEAEASAVVLRDDYADAYVVEKEVCRPLFDQQSPLLVASNTKAFSLPNPLLAPLDPLVDEGLEKQPEQLFFNAYKGQGLRQALGQFAQENEYDRIVMDINTQDVDQMTAKEGYNITVPALSHIDLASIYNNMPVTGIYLHSVESGDVRSLVVTDQVYRQDQSLIVFDVESGSLLANIHRLSAHYGWKVASEGWQLPVDYQIKYGYPLLVNDFFGGLAKLLKRYPVQAQLMQHTQEVAFVSRPLTANKTSDY